MKSPKETKMAIEMMREHMEPRLRLSSEMLPEIKKWKVGKDYRLEVEVTQESLEKDDEGMSARFKVKSVKAV